MSSSIGDGSDAVVGDGGAEGSGGGGGDGGGGGSDGSTLSYRSDGSVEFG